MHVLGENGNKCNDHQNNPCIRSKDSFRYLQCSYFLKEPAILSRARLLHIRVTNIPTFRTNLLSCLNPLRPISCFVGGTHRKRDANLICTTRNLVCCKRQRLSNKIFTTSEFTFRIVFCSVPPEIRLEDKLVKRKHGFYAYQ